MAVSCGLFSTFLTGETAALVAGPSSSSMRLALPQPPANLRMARAVTFATVSQPPIGRQPRGITKPRRVSPEMQALVGVSEIPRTQVLKQIWAYIKEHNLQDPENKKIIVCDEKLKKIFGGKDRVGFLEIAGLITPHFLKES
ncbi:upstream activation factor subunit spp27-like [Quillaja saponaria]|uniref:Upstream activation factor subunit spp27-like n=1 Tax=Quillaja saponaria TaxID=32244 RepID=A0AAD7KV13_QUISA|nr:upstream activation factor subunit spp27-like [Quillaja saponaria]